MSLSVVLLGLAERLPKDFRFDSNNKEARAILGISIFFCGERLFLALVKFALLDIEERIFESLLVDFLEYEDDTPDLLD